MLASLKNTLPRRAIAARSITSTARLQSASVHGNDPHASIGPSTKLRDVLTSPSPLQLLEKEKQKNLANKQHETSTPYTDTPGWNEYLASDSEANVKADQHKDGTPSDLTQSTIEFVKKRDKEAAAPSSESYTPKSGVAGGGDHEHAHYAKEEIEGPLANKGQQSKAERDEVQGPLSRH